MFPFRVTNIVDQLPRLRAPLLGLFGKEDSYPSPEEVAELDEILAEENKPHEFHSYDHAAQHSSRSTARYMTLLPPVMAGNA